MRGPAGPETIISSRRRSARGSAVRRCVRVKMRPEGGKAVGDTGSPGGKGADAVGLVIAVELARCEVLVGEGACSATAVAAVEVFAEAMPPSGDSKKRSESGVGSSKKCSAAGTAIDGGDGGRNTGDSCAKRSRNAVDPLTWLVRAKIAEIQGGEREPPYKQSCRKIPSVDASCRVPPVVTPVSPTRLPIEQVFVITHLCSLLRDTW